VPVFLEGKTKDNQTSTAGEGCRVRYNQSGFGVKTARVALGVVSPNGIVEEVTSKPADQAANDSEEVEIAYAIVNSKMFSG
jgi:hypothetical protein